MAEIEILPGLSAIASRYDALICDIWGVLHNSLVAHLPAVEALRRFRGEHGPVVLLTNAPRPAADVRENLAQLRVPEDCYDAIQTSGMATREDLVRRLQDGPVKMFHLGPERDRGVFEGLDVAEVDAADAELVLCTGLLDHDIETPQDYRPQLEAFAARGVPLLCANPDIRVPKGSQLIYCAGALAQLYEALGGEAVYFGKPHAPVYAATLRLAERVAGKTVSNPLAIGDGLKTDIAGANAYGVDALFIADGLHGAELGAMTPENLARLFAAAGAAAIGAMPALMW